MADDILAKQYVEFAAKGAQPLLDYMKQLQGEFKTAKARQVEFTKGLNDGTYAKAARQAATLRDSFESLHRAARMQDALVEHGRLKRALSDGTYLKSAKQLVAIKEQYAQMKKSARLQDLIAEHGKFAGTLKYVHEQMGTVQSIAGKTFGVATASTIGWITAGMQGTVEAHRLGDATRYAARGFASAFKPAIDAVTNAIYRLGRWFDGLSKSEQATLRITTEWVIGLSAGVLVIGKMISMVASLTAALRTLGIVNATGAGGFLGGIGKSAMLGRFGLYAAAAAVAIGSIHDVATEQVPQLRKDIKSGHRGGGMGRMAINSGLGLAPNFLQKQFTGKNLDELLLGKRSWETLKERNEGKKDEKGDRLSVMGGEFGESGSAWDRLQSELLNTMPSQQEQQTAIMVNIYELLQRALPGGEGVKQKPTS